MHFFHLLEFLKHFLKTHTKKLLFYSPKYPLLSNKKNTSSKSLKVFFYIRGLTI